MKRVIRSIFYAGSALLCIFTVSACSWHRGGPESLIQYVENPVHGLQKAVAVGPCVFTFQYKPAAYIISMEHHLDGTSEKDRLRALDSMVWFNVAVRVSGYNGSPLKYDAQSMAVYQARLNYYLNDARRDFYLTCGPDSLAASSYWFEDNQGLTPMATMVVGFRLRHAATVQHDLTVAYYDRVFRSGIIKTMIKVKDINALPKGHQS